MDEKGKGIISYIFGLVGSLIVLFAIKGNNKRTVTHACQSIVLSVAYYAVYAIYSIIPFYIPFLSTIIFALYVVVGVMGIMNVVKLENPELPVVGGITKSIFGKMIDAAPEEEPNKILLKKKKKIIQLNKSKQ